MTIIPQKRSTTQHKSEMAYSLIRCSLNIEVAEHIYLNIYDGLFWAMTSLKKVNRSYGYA